MCRNNREGGVERSWEGGGKSKTTGIVVRDIGNMENEDLLV